MTKSGFLHKIAQYRFGNEIKKVPDCNSRHSEYYTTIVYSFTILVMLMISLLVATDNR